MTRTHDRLLVTRTMSKAFGLAGARVGYGIGAAQLVDYVERARGPYKVTSLAERAALAALSDTRDGWLSLDVRLPVQQVYAPAESVTVNQAGSQTLPRQQP